MVLSLTAIKKEIDMSDATQKMKLSNQALGAVMMALQESLLNQLDIVPILKGFELTEGKEGLIVLNPPTVRFSDQSQVTEQDLETMVK
jgi:hypothetical protein